MISLPSALASVLVLAALLSLFSGYSLFTRGSRTPAPPLIFLLFSLLLLLEAVGSYLVPGRAILEFGIFQPASFFSRLSFAFLPHVSSTVLRRLIDPSIWCLLLLLLRMGGPFFLSAVFFALTIAVESLALAGLSAGLVDDNRFRIFHHGCFLAFGVLLFRGYYAVLLSPEDRQVPAFFLRHVFLFAAFFASLAVTLPFLAGASRPMAFAHYYAWFPENWAGEFLGEKLSPPLLPELGRYQSGDSSVVLQHEVWAKEAGLSGFILDWWPSRRALKNRVFEISRQFSPSFSIALLYETLDLRQPHEKLLPGERPNIVFLSPERAKNMGLQWARIVGEYMLRPNYLKVGKRPVLFLYATRHLLGDVPARIEEARAIVREKTGFELFLVADEPYFEVMEGDASAVRLLSRHQPNWDRIRAFDALFAYNPYDASRKEHGGTKGHERFLDDAGKLFRSYGAVAANAGIPFFPMALSGYNDRAHRLGEDHFVVPRELPDGSSFLSKSISRWVLPFFPAFGPRLFTLTSWNEWNEGTQVEPEVEISEPSSGGAAYTQNETYRGRGRKALSELRTVEESLTSSGRK